MPDGCLQITGYHGTLKNRAVHICMVGFNPSTKENEWLGHGVYFFEKFNYAKKWAISEANRQNSEHQCPVVLIAEIHVPVQSFLDLDNVDVMQTFRNELKRLYSLTFQGGQRGAPQFNNKKEARCFFCNLYTKVHPEIKVLAFTFIRDICYDEYGFPYPYGQRQLCVIDNSCIEMPLRMEVV